jgi:hypothetical protein
VVDGDRVRRAQAVDQVLILRDATAGQPAL